MMSEILGQGLSFLSAMFVVMVGVLVLAAVLLFISDVFQTKDAIRHNYPAIGRFRDLFSTLGEFFRQYFFAMDREDMPFNRAEREWVYRSSRGADNTLAFGSTKNLSPVGISLFVNCSFPTLEEHSTTVPPMRIGSYCQEPYEACFLINISGMSYGALSKPAVRALSKGARLAGYWMNTGEGGLSSYHLEGDCDIVFQIDAAKYGVRSLGGRLDDDKLRAVAVHSQVKMFEIKISQGAKPGGVKVTAEIARIRGIEPGKDSISPNRHPEVSNFQELLGFVNHVRDVTGNPTDFKMVVGA